MIKFPEHTENTKITVCMKDGTRYVKMDVPEQPFGKNERLISFWVNDTTVRTVPIKDVEYIDCHFEE